LSIRPRLRHSLPTPRSSDLAWVRVFTEALAVELKGTGVTATVLSPGLVHTEFHERAGLDREPYPEIASLNADSVVSAALADVRRDRKSTRLNSSHVKTSYAV